MFHQLKRVFKSLHDHEVMYVTIGGVAAVLHGVPRATFDLDILIEKNVENAKRLLEALEEAGFATATLTTPEAVAETVVTVFDDIVHLDVQTKTPGIKFEEVWQRKIKMEYEGLPFYVVSREDLIAAKKAAGRDVDLEDVRLLQLPPDREAT